MSDNIDFGEEMARLHPALMCEIMKRQQEGVIMKGDLSFSSIMLLDALKEMGAMAMGEIAMNLNISMGAATGMVDKLIEKKMVRRERDPNDRRVVRVELEDAGKRICEEAHKERVVISNEFYSPLTEQERQQMLRLFRKIYNSLRQK